MKVILLIDDCSVTRMVTGFAITRAGFQVREAESGAEAIDYLNTKESNIDLVITDMNMPGMNGTEVIQLIRSLARYSTTPVIAHSYLKNAGANAFLEKPAVPAALMQLITHLTA